MEQPAITTGTAGHPFGCTLQAGGGRTDPLLPAILALMGLGFLLRRNRQRKS
jgi:MYXO-CTERM domain-containing protein